MHKSIWQGRGVDRHLTIASRRRSCGGRNNRPIAVVIDALQQERVAAVIDAHTAANVVVRLCMRR